MNYDLIIVGDSREGLERGMACADAGGRVAVLGPIGSPMPLDLLRRALAQILDDGDLSMSAWKQTAGEFARRQLLRADVELKEHGIERIVGSVRFTAVNTLEVDGENYRQVCTAPQIVLATGTRSQVPNTFRGNGRAVVTIETLLELAEIPASVVVVGAGETGMAGAGLLAELGSEVMVVDQQVSQAPLQSLLDFSNGVPSSTTIAFRLGEEAIGTEERPGKRVAVRLASGRELMANAVLVCLGRIGNTDDLNLDVAGVGADEQGRIWCDLDGRTWNPFVSAVGDVVGFPRRPQQRSQPQPVETRYQRKSTAGQGLPQAERETGIAL